MNYQDLEQLRHIKRSMHDNEINSGLKIPITQNLFTGVMLTITIITVAWIVNSIRGIDFIVANSMFDWEDYIKLSLVALFMTIFNYAKTLLDTMGGRRRNAYGEIGVYTIFYAAVIMGLMYFSLTETGIFWCKIGLVVGLLWTCVLCILRFSSEESFIAVSIYKLGRASLFAKISGLEQTIHRLNSELADARGDVEIPNTDTYSKRKTIINDAITLYDVAADETKEAPSRRVAADTLNIPQSRWEKARDALRAIEAVTTDWKVLNRDRAIVERRLAQWISEHY